MALDEPLVSDEVIEEKGITFLIDKVLLEEAKPINVDFITTPSGTGFKLSSPMTASDGAGCGGSCSSC
jgi:Fe-S cluster assembly iron-binding protein IscA